MIEFEHMVPFQSRSSMNCFTSQGTEKKFLYDFIAIAKSFARFEVALCRHSGVRRNPVFSIPRHAGLDPGLRRGDGSRERHYFWQLL
jgi:hypothetical protein